MPFSWAEADRQFYSSAAGKAYLAAATNTGSWAASSSSAAPIPSVVRPSAAHSEQAVPQLADVSPAQLIAVLPKRPAPPVPAPTPLAKHAVPPDSHCVLGPGGSGGGHSSGGVRGLGAHDSRGPETFELPAVVLDGTTYLYDFDGRSMGIEHLLFTEEGEPVAVWNPVTGKVEEVEIVYEGSRYTFPPTVGVKRTSLGHQYCLLGLYQPNALRAAATRLYQV